MKRELDLARQLLLDIEGRGADCSVSVLRSGPNHEAEERIRYHLLLLVDAGLLKEIDRTAAGVPCVRLTDAGHETIELVRNENRWREAKWACQERTGGLSLIVIRGILRHWALEAPRYAPSYAPRRRYEYVAPAVEHRYAGRRSPYRLDPYVETSIDARPAEDLHYVRVRPAYRNSWRFDGAELNGTLNGEYDAAPTLPDYLI